MNYSFDWGTVVRGWPYLMEGMGLTLLLVAISMVLGIFIGTCLQLRACMGRLGCKPLLLGTLIFFALFR